MTDARTEREQALRTLPLTYSLALRLRDAGVAPEVICEYIHVDVASLPRFYRMAEAKLSAEHQRTRSPNGRCIWAGAKRDALLYGSAVVGEISWS
jgi:hypothetical protein